MVTSTPVQPEEKLCQQWMSSEFLEGGVQTVHAPNPFDDEKGEVHSVSSAAVTPLSSTTPTDTRAAGTDTQTHSQGWETELSGTKILQCLMEGNLSNQYLKVFLFYIQTCRDTRDVL